MLRRKNSNARCIELTQKLTKRKEPKSLVDEFHIMAVYKIQDLFSKQKTYFKQMEIDDMFKKQAFYDILKICLLLYYYYK